MRSVKFWIWINYPKHKLFQLSLANAQYLIWCLNYSRSAVSLISLFCKETNAQKSFTSFSAYHLIYGGMKPNALKSLSLTLSVSTCILYFAMLFVSFIKNFIIEKLLDIHRDVFWNNVFNPKSFVGKDEISSF